MNVRISLLLFILINTAFSVSAQLTRKVMDHGPGQTLHYWQYIPQNYESASDQNFPLVMFLHGGGEVGDSLELVKKHGLPKLISQGKEFSFVMIAPQNPEDRLWDDDLLLRLLDEVIADYRIDEGRVYLTGLSRGGFATWRMAIQNPDKFAAIVPISGGGLPDYVSRIKDVPVWAFHGARDQLIPLSRSVAMVEALQAAGGNVKLTVYPKAAHDAWTPTYENPKLYEWLLQQSR